MKTLEFVITNETDIEDIRQKMEYPCQILFVNERGNISSWGIGNWYHESDEYLKEALGLDSEYSFRNIINGVPRHLNIRVNIFDRDSYIKSMLDRKATMENPEYVEFGKKSFVYKYENPFVGERRVLATKEYIGNVFDRARRRSPNSEEQLYYEALQRLRWYIDGIGVHGLTPDVFSKLSTKRLCELYNIDIEHFKIK